MNRRSFLTSTLAAGAALGTGVFVSAQTPAAPAVSPSNPPAPAAGAKPAAELMRKPALESTLVWDFVKAGHGNIPKVKEMLAAEPMLINAMWDWGAGDWETAIGGASHVGNRECALHLLDAGARFDAFCAAMLNESDLVTGMMRLHPALANARGPHGYTLLYHVGYSGNVAMAESVAAQIASDARAKHFNQSLQSSVGRNHIDLVAYLLDHGVDDPNTKNFQGKTVLDVAVAKKFDEVAKLLRAHGGATTG